MELMRRSLLAGALAMLAASFTACGKDRPPDLSGSWRGWGEITIIGTKGTYTDTYHTGPGEFTFRHAVKNCFEGTWGESEKRRGTMRFRVSDDGQTATGTDEADENCEINPGSHDTIYWTRR